MIRCGCDRYTCNDPAVNAAQFESTSGRWQYPFQGHTQPVMHMTLLEDGLHVLTSANDCTHKLWTVEGKGLCTFLSLKEAMQSGTLPCFSTCGKFLVAGCSAR